MEQRIRFCTSADGTRIAYATYGEPGGRPILTTHAWTVVQEITGIVSELKYYEELTSDRQLIAFDRRGIGASQRDVDDVGLAAQLADLAAIADDASFETFDMAGMADGATVAAVYAARHPERVARLALSWAYSRGEEIIRPERARTIAALIREDWPLGRRALADLFVTEASTETRRQFSDVLRDSVSAEIAARYLEYFTSLDVRKELMELRSPTLIVQHPQVPPAWRTAAVSVASLIPGARLVAMERRGILAVGRQNSIRVRLGGISPAGRRVSRRVRCPLAGGATTEQSRVSLQPKPVHNDGEPIEFVHVALSCQVGLGWALHIIRRSRTLPNKAEEARCHSIRTMERASPPVVANVCSFLAYSSLLLDHFDGQPEDRQVVSQGQAGIVLQGRQERDLVQPGRLGGPVGCQNYVRV